MKRILLIIMLALGAAMFGKMEAANRILVDKSRFMLYVITADNDTVFSAPVCVGKNPGNKKREGDCRTPEGKFKICMIQDSRKWPIMVRDKDGVRRSEYGPWFMRLLTPKWHGIGIHGTVEPESIGTRASLGCIRMHNEDLKALREFVKVGTPVEITPN